MDNYFPPHQKNRKEVLDRIHEYERGIAYLQKELDRRTSETDEFKYGVPVSWYETNELHGRSYLVSGWKLFDSFPEAVDAAPGLLPDLDKETAAYRVEKVYI